MLNAEPRGQRRSIRNFVYTPLLLAEILKLFKLRSGSERTANTCLIPKPRLLWEYDSDAASVLRGYTQASSM